MGKRDAEGISRSFIRPVNRALQQNPGRIRIRALLVMKFGTDTLEKKGKKGGADERVPQVSEQGEGAEGESWAELGFVFLPFSFLFFKSHFKLISKSFLNLFEIF
jgi:hypothetical protein